MSKRDDLEIKSEHLDTLDADVALGVVEMSPDTATDAGLLKGWEALVGIVPDPLSSVEERRENVITSLRALGGISVRYFKELALSFGYNYGETASTPRIWFVEGTEFQAFRADYSKAGDKIFDPSIEQHTHAVKIFGTSVEENTSLKQLFERLIALGVSLTFHNE